MRHTISYSIRFCFVCLFALAALASCVKEEGYTPVPNPDQKVSIEIFTRAYSYDVPVGRATANESEVGMTPWVVVFKDNGSGVSGNAEFVEAVQAVEWPGRQKRYVELTRQSNKCWLLILANPKSFFYANNQSYSYTEANFETVLNNKTLSGACSLLQMQPLSNPQNTIPLVGESIPMSYMHEVPSIDENTIIANADNSPLELARAVAKIIVKNEATTQFNLLGITSVVNVSRQTQLHNLNATVPVNPLSLTEYKTTNPTTTNLVTAVSQTTEGSPVYVFETKANAADYAYAIIQGRYGLWNYYYKIPLVDASGAPLDILRNHSYTFTIKSVKKPGYPDIESAMAEIPSVDTGLGLTLTVNDVNGNEVVANDKYYLALSNSYFVAYTDAGTGRVFDAFTIITNCIEDFDNAYLKSSEGLEIVSATKIPVAGATPASLVVQVKFTDPYREWHEIEVQLGDLYKKVTLIKKAPVAKAGTGNAPIVFYTEADGFTYYLFGADVSNPSSTDWIKLMTSSDEDREIPSSIIVDNGQIHIEVDPNTGTTERLGIVEMSATENPYYNPGLGMPSIFKIRVAITQKGT